MTLYLAESDGTPHDVFRSGQLIDKPHKTDPPALVISDPHELPELEVAKYAESEDLTSQFRAFQRRAITFHSEPFRQDTEIAGHIRLALTCAADAPDFDLWAQVLMVLKDGSAIKLG